MAALEERSHNVQPLLAGRITADSLAEIDLLLLPDVQVLPQPLRDSIIEPWVQAGGTLVVSGNTGRYRGRDELYYRNPEGGMMAASVELSSEFRVLDVTELFPNSGNYRAPGISGWSYDVSPRDGRFVLRRYAAEQSDNGRMIRVTINWFEELRELMRVP